MPDAKRVLLTAYADTEAAIAAINEVALDYYLLKPWDPPEEQLFPVVEDLLTTWEAGAALEAGGVRVVGHRFSKESHDLRDFLVRNRVPGALAGRRARRRGARAAAGRRASDADRLPVALLEDGAVLERPTVLELAERLGVVRHARRRTTTTSWSSAAARPGSRPRCTAPRRGCKTRDGRARGARRPGRAVEPDRELPRLPGGAQRLGPRAPRDRPGAAARRRAADGPGGRRPARRGRRRGWSS